MLPVVEVMCPRALCLSMNYINNSLRYINQTIDLYDYLYLKESKLKEDTIHILNSKNLSLEEKEHLNFVFDLFFDYTKLPRNSFIIDIQKKEIADLGYDDNILAGLLLALNYYYNNYLDISDLEAIASKINLNVVYFLRGGYLCLDLESQEITRLKPHDYSKYILVDSSLIVDKNKLINNMLSKNNNSKNNILFSNDCLEFMPYKVQQIDEFLKQYSDIKHSVSGLSPINFVTFENSVLPSKLCISIKKEFSNSHIHLCKNVSRHKIMLNYKK